MKIAAAYIRVSTEEQDEYSLDSQLKLIREYGNAHGYIVPEEFVFEDDGISGRNARKRKDFQNMIALAKDKEPPFEAILVWKFSRFARNQEESIVYKSLLAKSGVSVISISEPLPEGPFASLIERIIEWMDEFYSIRLSGEVKRGMLEKASRGEPLTHPPFGYSMVDKRWYPNEDANTVRWVFEQFNAGMAMKTIATHLSDMGVKTFKHGVPDNRFVEYMLHNPAYRGKIRWSKDGRAASTRDYNNPNIIIIDGLHDAIIDEETWEKAQERSRELRRRYRKYQRLEQPKQWMLKGLVKCSSCGSTLVYQSLDCPSMQCHSYGRGTCKVSHSLSIAKANKAVIAALENCVANGSFNINPSEPSADNPKKDFGKLIKAEEAKLMRVQQAYEAGIDTLEEYAEKKKKIIGEIAKLREENEASSPVPVYDKTAYIKKVQAVIDLIKSPDVAEDAKNEAFRSILTHIVYEKAAQNLALYFYI